MVGSDKPDSAPSPSEDLSPKAQAEQPIFDVFSKKGEVEYRSAMQEVGPYLTLGIQMAMVIGVCAAIGYWLDSNYDSTPLWTGILSAFGAVAGLAYFLLAVTRLGREQEARDKRKRNSNNI